MYLATTFLLAVSEGFLNGAGSTDRGAGSITEVKQYQIRGTNYPYVSAQAMRKWIRTTVNHLTNQFSYYDRINQKNPTKKDMKNPEGKWVDPITFIEDDLFGYTHPFYNQPDQPDKKHLAVTFANRSSPYQATALISLPNTASINDYDGWVNPGMDTSLPFNTQMMSGLFEASTTLDITRIGVFRNYGDIVELDPYYQEYYLEEGEIEEVENDTYEEFRRVELNNVRKEAIELYYDSILNLYGAAKSTLFATDLTPRLLITAALSSANNLFHGLVRSKSNGQTSLNSEKLITRLQNRASSLQSDVYIGYRTGTFDKKYESEIQELDGMEIENTTYKLVVCSPGVAAKKVQEQIEDEIV